MNKHTQGEWNVVIWPHCYAIEVVLENGQEHTIATDQFCYASKFNGDALANAKLIAAAPDLLEFINRMVSESNFIDEQDKQDAISLIKKAKGG